MSDLEDEVASELRVEHVLAALDQISLLTSRIRRAVEGLDPQMVLMHGGVTRDRPPSAAGRCEVAPAEE
jgi:hypothetical protein